MPEAPQHQPGWYPDPDQPNTQRYWDGNAWTDQRAPMPPAKTPPAISPQAVRAMIGGVLAVLAILYFTGKLDHALYPIGLNLNECGKNGFGSVYCGDELDSYREEVAEPAEEAQRRAQESLRELESEGY